MLNVKRLILYQLLLMCSMLQRTNGNILKRLPHHIGILALFSNQISIATISLHSIEATHIGVPIRQTLKLTGRYDGIMQVFTARISKSLVLEVDVIDVGSVPIGLNS